jgi:hypothetical protein
MKLNRRQLEKLIELTFFGPGAPEVRYVGDKVLLSGGNIALLAMDKSKFDTIMRYQSERYSTPMPSSDMDTGPKTVNERAINLPPGSTREDAFRIAEKMGFINEEERDRLIKEYGESNNAK